MNNNKHICDLLYCSNHQLCIFKNAMSELQSDSRIVALGEKINSNRIVCYGKENVFPKLEEPVIKRIEDSDDAWKFQLALRKNKPRKDIVIKKDKDGNVIRCSNIYCGTGEDITQHHLIPNPYRKAVEGGNRKIPLCDSCHKKVHRLRTNKQLALCHNTKESVIQLLGSDIPFRVSRVINAMPEYRLAVA